jgi:hypothetical protein
LSKRLIAMLAGVVAIAVIVAGCGSSSDNSLTKAEYVKQGDAICKKGNTEIETDVKAYAKQHNISLKSKPTEAQLAELSENVVIPGVRNQLEGLRDLSPPSGDEGAANELLDALGEGLEKGEEDPAVFVSSGDPLAKANKMAKELGFKECGQE